MAVQLSVEIAARPEYALALAFVVFLVVFQAVYNLISTNKPTCSIELSPIHCPTSGNNVNGVSHKRGNSAKVQPKMGK